MENSRTCEIYKDIVHTASFVKHLRRKKHLENEKQNQVLIPEWIIKENMHLLKTKLKKYITLEL